MNLKKIFFLPLMVITFVVGFNSCAQMYDNTQEVSYEDAGQLMDFQYATVIDVSNVRIKDPGTGAMIGAVLGAVIGSFVGEGKANTLATMTGGLTGAYLGYKSDTANAQQITIEFDDGTQKALVVKGTEFRPGDRVRLIYRNGKIVRVEKVSRR